jgi:hypothetical protein
VSEGVGCEVRVIGMSSECVGKKLQCLPCTALTANMMMQWMSAYHSLTRSLTHAVQVLTVHVSSVTRVMCP